ncbi:MAG: flagellar hook protein FlgE [Chloroflexi bacterium]|nr:flagellar hook protein FlgE [Chloroflexota bacterium]
MMRSVFSAISGLRSHQTLLDVVGNNIANVNTTAFKVGRVTFQDILSQTVRGASSTTAARGGSNPVQVGLGMAVAAIDTVGTQGNLQATNKQTDLAIQGDGYFLLNNGGQTVYTRDGAFDLATDGTLVNPSTGYRVLGWNATNGVVDTSRAVEGITIPIGQGVIGQVSTTVTLKGNLDRDVTAPFSNTVATYDSLGGQHKITLTFTKTGANTWTWTAASAVSDGTTVSAPTDATITFDGATGKVASPTAGVEITITPPATTGAPAYTVSVDPRTISQLTSPSELVATTDGAAAGSLVSFSIGTTGEVAGIYTNGLYRTLGQLALATFPNPGGLMKSGNNLYAVSLNSGAAQVGVPGTGSRGSVSNGFLEMSNVDLAQQFTSMIIAQRGFQANSRVFTTSDEMLQDLVNLKR